MSISQSNWRLIVANAGKRVKCQIANYEKKCQFYLPRLPKVPIDVHGRCQSWTGQPLRLFAQAKHCSHRNHPERHERHWPKSSNNRNCLLNIDSRCTKYVEFFPELGVFWTWLVTKQICEVCEDHQALKRAFWVCKIAVKRFFKLLPYFPSISLVLIFTSKQLRAAVLNTSKKMWHFVEGFVFSRNYEQNCTNCKEY